MNISKTDVTKLVKYLDDAAKMYDTMPGQRNVCRAWVLRQQKDKLQRKLQNEDKRTAGAGQTQTEASRG